jgi:tetratricopeptide (TPR) repeat protein
MNGSGRHLTGGLLIVLLLAVLLGWASRTVGQGEPAPPFALKDVDGRTHRLSDFADRPLLLLFWAVRNERMAAHSLDLLGAALREVGRRPELRLVTILSQPAGEALPPEAERFRSRAPAPLLLDPESIAYGDYGIMVLPTVLLLDREHRLRDVIGYTTRAPEKLAAALTRVLGAPAGERSGAAEAEEPAARTPGLSARLRLVRKLLAKGHLDHALAELNKLPPEQRETAACSILEARILLAREELDPALEAVTRGLELEPDHREGLLVKAEILAAGGEAEAALGLLERVGGRDELAAAALARRARLLQAAGACSDALQDALKALEILLEE